MASKVASRINPAKAPISTHPAFPAIVAAWFGSLLGIGSLIVPAALFEQAAAASSLTAIMPAAEAPLGSTARLLIAVTLAVVGGFAGLLLARRIDAANQSEPATSSESQTYEIKVPISALEELGAASLDQPVEGRRRAVFAAGEPDDDNIMDVAALEYGHDLASAEWADEEAEEVSANLEMTLQGFDFEVPGVSRSEDVFVADTPDEAAVAMSEEPASSAAAQAPMTAEQLIRRPLDELGIVQLVERFALSLQQRPASAFHRAPHDLPKTAPSEFAENYAEEDDFTPLPANYPAELPAALRPIDLELNADEDEYDEWDWDECTADNEENEDSEDEEFSSLLALRKSHAEPRKSVTLPADDECDLEDSVAVFPGHESMAPRRRFDAPFSVTPAGAEPAGPAGADETERTLRGALEQLRKMSGTG
ncbi:hypothetical protein [Allopontixanthobacter sediminis]|uniref:Uncharacterized protein n=1 Tax=Allopontixanthobacter sediminis TaxID=1689985 RepID=A0A845B282_9SPHN|nr:hypothetical protein [Allopontixanthobacter sediminis]MXP44296.1 hypothetical protein [Allopontixanthobacter sediminis]